MGYLEMTRLEFVRQKAKRAKEQFHDLDAEVRVFRDSCPYEVIPDYDTKPGQIRYCLASVKPVPLKIAHLSGEVIHTLRSTLDHLVYQLLLAANPTAPDEERSRVDFPIYDPAKQTEARAFRHIQPLGPKVVKAISSFKPYKGGNNLLWALHVLDNISKHRTLLTIGIVHGGIDFTDALHALMEKSWGGAVPRFKSRASVSTARTGYPAEVGDVLFVGFPVDEEVNQKLQFPYQITLSESEINAGEPLLETLHGMADFIDNMLSDFALLL
jgi:hypothetical protein